MARKPRRCWPRAKSTSCRTADDLAGMAFSRHPPAWVGNGGCGGPGPVREDVRSLEPFIGRCIDRLQSSVTLCVSPVHEAPNVTAEYHDRSGPANDGNRRGYKENSLVVPASILMAAGRPVKIGSLQAFRPRRRWAGGCRHGCSSRILPPTAAAVLAMNAPISIDKAMKMATEEADLRAASAIWRAFAAAAFS